jgi:hypothetical protein
MMTDHRFTAKTKNEAKTVPKKMKCKKINAEPCIILIASKTASSEKKAE